MISRVTALNRGRGNTVRRKTFAAIAATTIVLTVVLCTIARFFLVQRFSDLEETRVTDCVERAKIAIQDEIVQLDRIAVDNAIFDETVKFMDHPSNEYIKSNFGIGNMSTLARENYQALAFMDTSGRVVAAKAYDPAKELDIDISRSLAQHFSNQDRLIKLPLARIPVTGILLVKEGPMTVSAQSILASDGRGPIRGVLFMGCYLKRQDIQRLEGKTHLQLSVGRLDDRQLAPDYAFARSHLSSDSAVLVRALNDDTIAGYALLKDIYGKPALVLRAELARTIYHQGQLTLLYLAGALTIAGLVFGVLIELILGRVLLSRLRTLDLNVGDIAESGDAGARVSACGDDELGRFGKAINRMLDSLQLSQIEKRQAEERYRAFMDNSPLLAAIKDEEGRYVYVNEPFALAYRTNCGLISGFEARDLLGSEAAEQIRLHDREALACGHARQFEETFATADGVERNWLSLRFPLQSEGERRLIGVLSLDITSRKRAEKELQEAKEAAESAAVVKSHFLTNVSHELRTPMNGIMGLTELVLASPLEATQREHISLIKFSAESLLGVVNDVLDFSKIEAGRLELDILPFAVEELLRDCVALPQVMAKRKGLRIFLDPATELPRRVAGDPTRLRQILLNLIGNAVKFTQHGEVRVSAGVTSSQGDEVVLHFKVSDTGVGIPEDKQEVIFERFSQADSSTTRQFGGTGLGLAISSGLVAMMNGQIWVESRMGAGSTFHFTAKMTVQPDVTAPTAPETFAPDHVAPYPAPENPANFKILVAEDNRVNQIVVERLLKAKGHSIVMADNGRQALQLLQKESFDLLITDVQMPELDGCELAAAIRSGELQTGLRLPILGLSAHAFAQDRERCLVAGMDAYLTKPVRPEQLNQTIARLAPAAILI